MEIQVVVVLDESGSMESIRDETIKGYNEYIEGLKGQGGLFVTLALFDSTGIRKPYVGKPIRDVPALTRQVYRPNAATPLYDAIGETIGSVAWRPGETSVLFVVITDGYENASKEYTREMVTDKIAALEKEGWTFTYLGANQDAWGAAQTMGYAHQGNTLSFQGAAIADTFSQLRTATMSYAAQASASISPTASINFFSEGSDADSWQSSGGLSQSASPKTRSKKGRKNEEPLQNHSS